MATSLLLNRPVLPCLEIRLRLKPKTELRIDSFRQLTHDRIGVIDVPQGFEHSPHVNRNCAVD
jgi:hypothetical protein